MKSRLVRLQIWFEVVELIENASNMSPIEKTRGFWPTRKIAREHAAKLGLTNNVTNRVPMVFIPEGSYVIKEHLIVPQEGRKTIGQIVSRKFHRLGPVRESDKAKMIG